jgi:hypothetical protein
MYIGAFDSDILKKLVSADKKSRTESFEKFDSDKSGAISYEEWEVILQGLKKERLKYFKKAFFISDHVYSGLGMEPGVPVNTQLYETSFPNRSCNCNPFKRGWYEDFVAYCCNNHPIIRLWYSDKINPYKPFLAGVELVGSLITSFAGTGLMLGVSATSNYGILFLFQVRYAPTSNHHHFFTCIKGRLNKPPHLLYRSFLSRFLRRYSVKVATTCLPSRACNTMSLLPARTRNAAWIAARRSR